jgi:Ca2+-binding RTX toxin-like protein
MSFFRGHTYLVPGTSVRFGLADQMHGTSSDDTFLAGGGNDTIYAGAGDDYVSGGSGNDHIYASAFGVSAHAAWGHDAVYGGAGDDIINYTNTTSSVILYGDDLENRLSGHDEIWGGSGSDRIYGGGGGDNLYGGDGNDTIYGDTLTGAGSGDDYIFGQNGNDTIYGGAGKDNIWGGADVDYLTGGSGADTFHFEAGDSGRSYADADVIYDFNRNEGDKLDLPGAATASNFGHIKGFLDTSHNTTYAQDYKQALDFAQNVMSAQPGIKYEFVTDGHNGWLFANLDRLPGVDFGIELKGVTDLHWQDIV